jgi:hypothetical protein
MREPYWTQRCFRRAGFFFVAGLVAILFGISDFHTPGVARFLEPGVGFALLVLAARDFSFAYRKLKETQDHIQRS